VFRMSLFFSFLFSTRMALFFDPTYYWSILDPRLKKSGNAIFIVDVTESGSLARPSFHRKIAYERCQFLTALAAAVSHCSTSR
jgi:hypothetical protein